MTKCNIEMTGTKALYPDEVESARISSERYAKKFEKYGIESLKLKFRTHGNVVGSHLRKAEVDVQAIKGKNVYAVKKELGQKDEDTKNKSVKKWNVGKLVQETLDALYMKVQKESSKNI